MTRRLLIARQRKKKTDNTPSRPKIAAAIVDCPDVEALGAVMARLSPDMRNKLTAIYVYFVMPPERVQELGKKLAKQPGWEKLVVLRNVRDYGYGGNRKIALTYALEQGWDAVLTLPATPGWDKRAPALLLEAGSAEGVGLVHGARQFDGAYRCGVTDRLLNLAVDDWHSGLRLYQAETLRRVPFTLNDDDERFDVQLLVQAKALGVRIVQVALPVEGTLPSSTGPSPLGIALSYRIHQLHLWRHGRWLVDRGERYTFKKSPTSSHRQILDATPGGSRVLDLGCSQGLLADQLQKKGCHVVGVDKLPAKKVRLPYEQYVQADLDDPGLRLPYEREFDVVILSDVIEHLQNREAIMTTVRRHLTENGRLIISTGNVAIWFYRISLLLGRFEYGPRGILDETHVRLYTQATFERLITNAGFEILRRRSTPLPFELIFETRADSLPLRLLDGAYHALTRLWPAMFAYQFIVEARIARLEAAEASIWPQREAKR